MLAMRPLAKINTFLAARRWSDHRRSLCPQLTLMVDEREREGVPHSAAISTAVAGRTTVILLLATRIALPVSEPVTTASL